MKGKIKKIDAYFKQHQKQIAYVMFLFLGVGTFIALAVKLILMAIDNLMYTLTNYSDAFMLLSFVVICLVYLVVRKKKPVETAPQPPANDTSEQEAAERTYINIAGVILPVLQKLCRVFPFVTPIQANETFCPSRARKNNEIWSYNYAVVKNGEADVGITKRFLNDELTRILCDHEAHGLASNTVFIQGVEYPALLIADVKDVGTYFEISVVVMNEKVYRHLNYRNAKSLETGGKAVNAVDNEFI